ncbi:MAG: hypothetical protein M0P01_01000 [Treponema sp.]|nr:hypothetical protein [Treponema sp.]
MMDTENSSKKLLKQYGILAGIIVGLFGLLTGIIVLSENKWHTGLREEIIDVLEEKAPGEWIVGEYVGINAPIALNSVCFQVRRKDNGARKYAVLIRIETIYGPLPAVFLYNDKSVAKFIGIAGLHGRVQKVIEDESDDARINYWIKRIPDIVRNTATPAYSGVGAIK